MAAFGAHDFFIVPRQISSSKIVFNFAYTNPIWTKVRFNFFASATNEVQLGHFGARNLAISGNTANIGTSLKQAFGAKDVPIVRAFINGYMLKSNGVQVAVSAKDLTGTKLTL